MIKFSSCNSELFSLDFFSPCVDDDLLIAQKFNCEDEKKLLFDLQWFASAEEEGRTEEPTEHKLKKAR